MPASEKELKIMDFLKNNEVPERFTTSELSDIVGIKIAPITMTRLVIFAVLNVYETKPRTYSFMTKEEGNSLFR